MDGWGRKSTCDDGKARTGGEVEERGVEVEGREGAGGDDDGLEALEDGLDGQGRVQAGELQDCLLGIRLVVGWSW